MSKEVSICKECDKQVWKDGNYCIYHKSDKNEEEAREFYRRIRQEASEPEGEIIEDEEGEEHRRWVFEGEIDWRGYRFPDTPSDGAQSRPSHTPPVGDFKPAGGDIHIEIKFEDDVNLRDTSFEGMAGFFGAKFEGVSDFEEATFEGITSFFGAKFEKKANFQNTSFERAGEFMFTTFEENANFRLTTFEERANFMSATFEGVSDFDDATFKSETNFQHVTFGKTAFLCTLNLKAKQVLIIQISLATLNSD